MRMSWWTLFGGTLCFPHRPWKRLRGDFPESLSRAHPHLQSGYGSRTRWTIMNLKGKL